MLKGGKYERGPCVHKALSDKNISCLSLWWTLFPWPVDVGLAHAIFLASEL